MLPNNSTKSGSSSTQKSSSSTEKSSSSTEKSSSSTEKSSSTQSMNIQDINYDEQLTNICLNDGLEELTSSDEFRMLWNLIILPKGENKNMTKISLPPDKLIPSPNPLIITFKKNIIENLFGIKQKFNEQFITDLYNYSNIILFIYNSLEVIIHYLKCLFYTKYIKKNKLDNRDEFIYDYYKYLIISENPLIFKFIDFSKNDRTNKYEYTQLQTVFYEYDTKISKWSVHNLIETNNIKNIPIEIFQLTNKFDKFKETEIAKKTKFVIENIIPKTFNEEDSKIYFNRIYNSFDYIEFSDNIEKYNYFEYTGNYEHPYNNEAATKSKSNFQIFKNVIGIIDIKETPKKETPKKTEQDMNKLINDKNLSKTVFTLGAIFLQFSPDDNYPVYYRGNISTIFTKTNPKHFIYSVLDQVQEFNKLILFNSIFNDFNKEEIYILWNTLTHTESSDKIPFKFLLTNLLNYNIDEEYNIQYNFTEEIFQQLCKLLKTNINDDTLQNTYEQIFLLKFKSTPELWTALKDEIIKKIMILNNKFEEIIINVQEIIEVNKNDMYKYIEHYNIMVKNIKSNQKTTLSLLLATLLYSLDKYNFYDKRWLLNLYECTFIDCHILDIKYTGTQDQVIRPNYRIANVASLPINSRLILKGTLYGHGPKKSKKI